MQIIFLQTPEPGVPCELTLLSHLSNNVTLYGLYYPGIGNCVSWCYLTIAPGVIITTHLPTDGGTSITNSWSVAFLDKLKKLGPVAVAGNVRWFLEQPWLDDRLRPLFTTGLAALANLPQAKPMAPGEL